MTDLLPCPFCGGDVYPSFHMDKTGAVISYGFSCAVCGAGNKGFSEQKKAMTAWNTRTQAPTSLELMAQETAKQYAAAECKRCGDSGLWSEPGPDEPLQPCDCAAGIEREQKKAELADARDWETTPTERREALEALGTLLSVIEDLEDFHEEETGDKYFKPEAIESKAQKIRAALAQPDWMPIETAPRDGTEVLLAKWSGHPARASSFCWAINGHFEKFWTSKDPMVGKLAEPTHWMPIKPPAPQEGAE